MNPILKPFLSRTSPSRFQSCKARIKTASLLLGLALTCLNLEAFADFGGGVGGGNGFPGDPGTNVDGVPVLQIPAKHELLVLIAGIARELPTLAARIAGLERHFESGGKFGMVYYPIDYPYQRATSINSGRWDAEGYPYKAKISFWNEFTRMTPTEQ